MTPDLRKWSWQDFEKLYTTFFEFKSSQNWSEWRLLYFIKYKNLCRTNFDYFKILDWFIIPHGVHQVWPSYHSKSFHLQLSKSLFNVIPILFLIIRRDIYSTIHDSYYFPHEEKRKYFWGKKLLPVFYPNDLFHIYISFENTFFSLHKSVGEIGPIDFWPVFSPGSKSFLPPSKFFILESSNFREGLK